MPDGDRHLAAAATTLQVAPAHTPREATVTRFRRLLFGAIGACTLLTSMLVAAPTATALPPSIPVTIVSSGCSSNLPWKEGIGDGKLHPSGLYPGFKPHGASGTVKYCSWKYRMSDSDPSGDYYIGELTSAWTDTVEADSQFVLRDGRWSSMITTSVAAQDNV